MRCFIGCLLRPTSARRLAAACPVIAGARPVPPVNFHVTLHFIGAMTDDTARRLARAVAELGLPASRATTLELTAFPTARRARVVAVTVAPRENLSEWAGHCRRLHPTDAADRPFVPHVTFARLKPARRLELDRETNPAGLAVTLDPPELLVSHQTRAGIRYTPYADWSRRRGRERLADDMTLDDLNALDREGFVARLGGVFEHSPWVAETAWEQHPFASVAELHAAMAAAVDRAGPEQQLALLRAHPELAGREAQAGTLTRDSKAEQRSAGLDALTRAEVRQIEDLNRRYTRRFGFPFIVAVRRHTKDSLLATWQQRLANPPQVERKTALEEVAEIARLRLAGQIEDGPS